MEAAVGAEINYAGLELQKNINSGKLGTTQIKGESYAFRLESRRLIILLMIKTKWV